MRQFIRDNAINWLEDYRIDGLRWDATVYIRSVHGDGGEEGGPLPDGWALLQSITVDTAARSREASTSPRICGDPDWITGGGRGAGRASHPVGSTSSIRSRGALAEREDGTAAWPRGAGGSSATPTTTPPNA